MYIIGYTSELFLKNISGARRSVMPLPSVWHRPKQEVLRLWIVSALSEQHHKDSYGHGLLGHTWTGWGKLGQTYKSLVKIKQMIYAHLTSCNVWSRIEECQKHRNNFPKNPGGRPNEKPGTDHVI